jgi:hypothetical protein
MEKVQKDIFTGYNFNCFYMDVKFGHFRVSNQREKHRFRVIENEVIRRISGPKREEITGGCRKIHNEKVKICTLHKILLR